MNLEITMETKRRLKMEDTTFELSDERENKNKIRTDNQKTPTIDVTLFEVEADGILY